MPTVSRQQQKLMHGIASGNIKPKSGQPSKAVAQKFANADHKRGPAKLPQRIGQPQSVGAGIVQGKGINEL